MKDLAATSKHIHFKISNINLDLSAGQWTHMLLFHRVRKLSSALHKTHFWVPEHVFFFFALKELSLFSDLWFTKFLSQYFAFIAANLWKSTDGDQQLLWEPLIQTFLFCAVHFRSSPMLPFQTSTVLSSYCLKVLFLTPKESLLLSSRPLILNLSSPPLQWRLQRTSISPLVPSNSHSCFSTHHPALLDDTSCVCGNICQECPAV